METPSLYEVALALERRQEFTKALEAFQRCLEIADYDIGDVLFHCGWCVEHQAAVTGESAIKLYLESAERTGVPGCKINSYFRAGWLYMHMKEYSHASAAFKKAIDWSELFGVRMAPYYHAAFWYAVCLESQGSYRDALKWYSYAAEGYPLLQPESSYREILCLLNTGAYERALDATRRFDDPPPDGFARDRYEELKVLAKKEHTLLQDCLATNFLPREGAARRVRR